MFHRNYSIFYLLFILTAIEEGIAKCAQGSYLNLCGLCVGGTTGESELEGFDRCGICGGHSDCVACDGITNSLKLDACGKCSSPQSEKWNDCRKIDKVHPSFIDLSLDRDTVSVTITGAGLKESFLNSTKCFIQPLESQTDNPEIKEITLEENDIQLKINLTESTGNYRIGCTDIEGFAELTIADSRKLNVLKVYPTEVKIDDIVQFELEIELSKTGSTNEKHWCFMKAHSELVTVVARRKTETSFICNEYRPAEPGMAFIGIVANEEAAFYESGKTVAFAVRAKPPIPESAEYNFDMQHIVVHFDQNIRIDECNGTFSPETEISLGRGFTCSAMDNLLYLNLGTEPKLIDTLAIIGTNSIRRAGTAETELSPNTSPTVLWVSKGKVMAPIFTLTVPSAVCPNEESQPVLRLTVSKLSNQRLNYKWTLLPTKEWKGKNQRENMLIWKNIRAIEAELKAASVAGDSIDLSRKNLLPGIKYNISLSLANTLQKFITRNATASFQIQKTMLSVTVKTFPSPSVIIAEAVVIFCGNKEQNLLRFRWMIDDKVISAEGKFLMVPRVNPGDYNVSCVVFDQQTNEILGAGWAITQVVKVPGRVFIFPAEAVFGTMDDVVLLAYNEDVQFRWTCRTSHNEECIAVGSKARAIDEIINMTTSTVKIPAGTLSVGRYLWTLHGTENATATVIISAGIPPKINIVSPHLKIDSTKPLNLNAEVERLKKGCKIRWKTMHRKGYGYFNLESVGLGDLIQVREDELLPQEREVPLVLPTPGKNWTGLMGNEMYLLRLETICPEPIPEAHSDVTLLVNEPPSSSVAVIVPETGEALATKFSIQIPQGSDSSVNDYPLLYSLSCEDEPNNEISLITSISPKFDTFLPPGNITVTITTCDIWKSCSRSRKFVTVEESFNVSSRIIENLGLDIRNLILSGDTVEGYGKAIIAFKTLSKKADAKETLLKISTITESAVRERIRDLSERLKSDPKPFKLCYEFLEQSVSRLKYFPETEEMVKLLAKFKNLLTKSSAIKTSKRGNYTEQNKPVINQNLSKATLELNSRILENSNTAIMPNEDIEEERQTSISQMNTIVSVDVSGESSSHPEEESLNTKTLQFSKESVWHRSKRNDENELNDIIVNEGTVKAIFDLHAKILEQNSERTNWDDFLADVRKYMIEICTHIQDYVKSPFLIESTIVTLEVRRLGQSDLKKDVSVVGMPNAKLKFNFKSLPRKTCTAIAKYHKDFMGNATSSRVSDIYEVRIIKNGTFKNTFKDDIKSMTLTIPIYNNVTVDYVNCIVWKNESGWKQQCLFKAKTNSTVACICKDPGILAAFSTNVTTGNTNVTKDVTKIAVPVIDTNASTTTTAVKISIGSTMIPINTTTAAVIPNLTTTNDHAETNESTNVTVTQVVTTTTLRTTTSKEAAVLSSVIQSISNIRKNKSLHIYGTFEINENYNEVVGKNLTLFTEYLKMQIAEQLKINVKAIANVIVKPGSITVTVQFIDTEETSAGDAIKELVKKLHEGTLRLTGRNANVLNIPRQDLKVKIGSNLTRSTGRMRIIAYGVVTGTCVAIFLFAVGATYFRRKRRRMPLILPHLSIDDHPSYRQFNNEFSLDGSPASLARYRRDHPFETETVQ